jgi:hypothetical protein
VGRWLSPDPAGSGWNQYGYATNPNSNVDPTGLAQCSDLQSPAICQGGYYGGTGFFINWTNWDSLEEVQTAPSDGGIYQDGVCLNCATVPGGAVLSQTTCKDIYICAAANNGPNAPPAVPKPPNPILQNCPGPAPSPPSTGTEQDLEGLASFSHVADMAGVTMLGAGLMVGSPIAAGATCFYSGGLLCFAAIEAAPAGTVGGYYLMKSGAQQLTAMLPSKNGC